MDADNVALVDQLRAAAPLIPPSHLPTAAEVLGVVGALIAYGEFGDRFTEAVNSEDPAAEVGALWTPPEAEQTVEPVPAASPSAEVPAGSDADVSRELTEAADVRTELAAAQAENRRLLDQLAAARGAAGHPTTTVTPGDSPADVPPPPGSTS